ncbi:MAG TPA: extracellular solute-binding protein [Candidatus Sulfotelmatobacter sp.]|nr:extracellular solute-binding protein [Candidatus Sulfotelmatobacter sp.]
MAHKRVHGDASRRDFLKLAGAGAVGSMVGTAVGGGAALAAPKTLTFLHDSSFIRDFDTYFQKVLAPAYEKETGIKIDYPLTSVGTLQTRVSAIIETGSGADVLLQQFNWPFLYDEKLVDLSDLADEIGKAQGGWYEVGKEAVFVNGKWKAIPFGNIGQLMNYRMDWFHEVGFDKFPDTWDELLEAGIKLNAKGYPFGFELGHGFGDNHGWIYPLMWSFGAHEVDKDGKTVTVDSDEMARAIDFARKFFKATTLEDCLGWNDASNNKAYLSEQISCTNNAESILWVAKKDFPDIAKVTGQALNPKGPTGKRFHILNPWSHAVFTGASDIEASKKFLRWLTEKKQCEGWLNSADSYYAPFLHTYDDAAFWKTEPRNLPYQESLETSHLPGWPAPMSRPQAEVIAKYVIIDMFAKACGGSATKDVIKEATAQVKQIYGQA